MNAAMTRFKSSWIQTSYASACTCKICALSSSSSGIPVCCLKKVRSSSVKSYKLSSKASGIEMVSDMTRTYCTTVPGAGSYKYLKVPRELGLILLQNGLCRRPSFIICIYVAHHSSHLSLTVHHIYRQPFIGRMTDSDRKI